MVLSRWSHYPLIVAVWALVFLPNLGGPSLWDIDEGNNAEAAREMLLSGDWVVPYFNYHLREDKPALLYWCQLAAYYSFGVNEFSARFPSALAALLAALAAYELGRAMFSPLVGLLAGVALPTSLLFCAAGHFANPDALLTLSLTLAYAFFWAWYRGYRWAALPAGLSLGLGIMAKGPVALVLPTVVWTLFMLWQGRYWKLWRPGFLLGIGSWFFVAAPWYIWVTVETHGAWLLGFWFNHNQGRFLAPMESHGGPIIYYLPVLLIGLAPWSLFLIQALIDAVRGCVQSGEGDAALRQRDAQRYLLVWAGVYVAFFSCAATKLPNYVLPVYPALLVLIAARLERWRQGEALPGWVLPTGVVALVGTALAWFIAMPLLTHRLAGVEVLALLGLFPLIAAGLVATHFRQAQIASFLTAFAALAVVSTAITIAWGPLLLENSKAIKPLVEAMPRDHLDRDVRVLAFEYFQPSLVFYTQRLVEFPPSVEEVVKILRGPQPVYAVLPRYRWAQLQTIAPGAGREVIGRRDLYSHTEVVLITNEPPRDFARRFAAQSR
jgi:4-amino-4-deoxy-L-arabinose transferase-like glycosyltransferase